MNVSDDTPSSMVQSVGIALLKLPEIFEKIKPDLVFIIGDRYEVMSAAISASYMNIPLAHTMGGEVTGTIDESIRHSITKLAHLHFVSNADSYKRVLKLGELKKNVFNVGCPRIDFVKDCCKAGKSHNEIKAVLLETGWSTEQVDDVLGRFVDRTFPIAIPRPIDFASPRLVFLNIFYFLVLYLSNYSLVATLFTFLDQYLPDGLGRIAGAF